MTGESILARVWYALRLGTLVGTLGLAGCAMSIRPEDAARIRTLGIVSGCGGKLMIEHIGTVVFSNSEEIADIADWNLDTTIAENMGRALSRRYEILPVAYDPADFRYDPGLSFFGSPFDPGAVLRAHTKPQGDAGYDAYIVVWSAPTGDGIGQRNVQLKGTGIYDGNFLGIGQTAVFSACMVTMVDGHSFKKIAEDHLHLTPMHSALDVFVDPGHQNPWFTNVGRGDFAASFDMLSPNQKQSIHAALTQLLSDEIPDTLREMKLVQ